MLSRLLDKLNDTEKLIVFCSGLAVTAPVWGPWLLLRRAFVRERAFTAYAEGLHVYHRSRMSHPRYRYGEIIGRKVADESQTEYTVHWLDVPASDSLAHETCWHEELMPAPGDTC